VCEFIVVQPEKLYPQLLRLVQQWHCHWVPNLCHHACRQSSANGGQTTSLSESSHE
jgi:hypothetical protein